MAETGQARKSIIPSSASVVKATEAEGATEVKKPAMQCKIT